MTTPTDLPNWDELHEQFGHEAVSLIDDAIGRCLGAYRFGIKSDDYYLVSEGLTFAVLMAMRAGGLRFTDSVSPISPRRSCPVCEARVTITKGGKVRAHNRADGVFGQCPTSRLPEFKGDQQ